MGLLGCETQEEEKFFESEKGMFETIMKKADKFRDDSEIIEMYDRDTMLEQMRLKELNDALAKTTAEVTNKVTVEVKSDTTKKIAINMIKKGIKDDEISDITGLSIEEINELKKELN